MIKSHLLKKGIVSSCLALTILCVGCGNEKSGKNVSSNDATTTQAQPLTNAPTLAEVTTVTPTTEAPTTIAATTKLVTTQATTNITKDPTASKTTAPATSGEVIIGKTSKGYNIVQKDGITYVNGILIVNKTYSLPSDYNPGAVDAEVLSAFKIMQNDAAKEGLNIYISSGFRSYNTQNTIYNNYVRQDGQEVADTYSARAGHSEHQTGLCFDLNSIDDSFAATAEGQWVKKHAHEYGFIVRYPEGKEPLTGYMYESWHLRYLGDELAKDVYKSGLCLEEYLGITSKYSN